MVEGSLAVRIKGSDRTSSSTQIVVGSPVCCGFAVRTPRTPILVRAFRRESAEEDKFKKLEEMWSTKWHGDSEQSQDNEYQNYLDNFIDDRSLHSSLRRSSSFTKLFKFFGRAPEPEPEKFQFAEGFEDWPIPPYPEDYVDPAEIPRY